MQIENNLINLRRLYEANMAEAYREIMKVKEEYPEDYNANLDYIEYLRVLHLSIISIFTLKLADQDYSLNIYYKEQTENKILEICTEIGDIVEIETEFLLNYFTQDKIDAVISQNAERTDGVIQITDRLPDNMEEAKINTDVSQVTATESHEVNDVLSYENVVDVNTQKAKTVDGAVFENFSEIKEKMNQEDEDVNSDMIENLNTSDSVTQTDENEEIEAAVQENVSESKSEIKDEMQDIRNLNVFENQEKENEKDMETNPVVPMSNVDEIQNDDNLPAISTSEISKDELKENVKENEMEPETEAQFDRNIRDEKMTVQETEKVNNNNIEKKPDNNKKKSFTFKPSYDENSIEKENTEQLKNADTVLADKELKQDTETDQYSKTLDSFFLDQHVLTINDNVFLMNVYPLTYKENDPVSTEVFVTVMNENGNYRAFVSNTNGQKNINTMIGDVRIVIRAKWINKKFSSFVNLLDPNNEFKDVKTEIRPAAVNQNTHMILQHRGFHLHIFPMIFSNDKKTGLCPCAIYRKESDSNEIYVPTGLTQNSYDRHSGRLLEMYIEGVEPVLKVSEV